MREEVDEMQKEATGRKAKLHHGKYALRQR